MKDAGCFFAELFSGVDMVGTRSAEEEKSKHSRRSAPPVSRQLGMDVYPKSALEFEKELAGICRVLV